MTVTFVIWDGEAEMVVTFATSPDAMMNVNGRDQYEPVILSAAKNLTLAGRDSSRPPQAVACKE